MSTDNNESLPPSEGRSDPLLAASAVLLALLLPSSRKEELPPDILLDALKERIRTDPSYEPREAGAVWTLTLSGKYLWYVDEILKREGREQP